jgi:hypothetical protein
LLDYGHTTVFSRSVLPARATFPEQVSPPAMLAFADDAALAPLVIAAAQRRARLPPRRAFRSRGRGHARAASNGLRTPDILGAPTKYHRRYPMPQPRRRKPDRRRALELLAGSPTGCTEALLFAYGITVEMLVGLINAGLATATAERLVAGNKTIEIARVRITEAGGGR